jgi:DNA-binding transcriptional MerR regulator/uncharacterized damage-inducible protein DinB
LSRHYKIHEFAELAGVTVKALHHYDRLGLLRPGRTEAGYRVYCERDLETLEQIVALKFLGLPLKQIGVVLKREAQLPDALRLQRRALEEKHAVLGRAIRAIEAAEKSLESGNPADTSLLKHIIEVIDMQDGIAVMKKYYSEDAWERHKRYYEEGPSLEWRQLYRDGEALLGADPLGADPASDAAKALVERWFELSKRAYYGDPEVQTDSPTAWMDREQWPPVMKHRMAELKVEEVTAFIKLAIICQKKQHFSEEAWARLMKLWDMSVADHSRRWQARVDLFFDLEKAALRDPAGEIAQALVARWRSQLEEVSGGDPEIKGALLHGWGNRRHWPASMRWQVEAMHSMSFERFERAADFLDRAVAAAPTPTNNRRDVAETLSAEFAEEMANTRRMLERVPEDKLAWKPHEKSSTLAKLASHIAAIPIFPLLLVKMEVGEKLPEVASKLELLERFDKNVAAGRDALMKVDDDRLERKIPVSPGVSKPLMYVLRSRVMNHLIHHRGQLSVYLRLLEVAVPGVYGPSADEKAL